MGKYFKELFETVDTPLKISIMFINVIKNLRKKIGYIMNSINNDCLYVGCIIFI